MTPQIYTKWNRPEKVYEKNSGKSEVEKAGYIPQNIRIEQFIDAGRRLVEYRREQFDFPDGTEIDESAYDPTREPGFDLADATQQMHDLRYRAEEAKAAMDAQNEASQNAQKASGEALEQNKVSEDTEK